ncbi:hypothetical protein [Vibrio sp. 10N.222.52.C12]|uniref:hypothetical protein n=1 Tax=Vibrio sp. 10N.222.52.C12 TaxID=3229630 RepID=UPI00354E6B77
MTEQSFDEYSHMEESIKSAQDELLSVSMQYDAILKNEDYYTYDYIELAAGKVIKAEMHMDTLLAEYYLLHPAKLDGVLKRKTDGANLVNIMDLNSFAQDHYEDPDCYQKLKFSDYIDYVFDSI